MTQSVEFTNNGTSEVWDVPDNVDSVFVDLHGGGGGSGTHENASDGYTSGGDGGRIRATIDVSNYSYLEVHVADGAYRWQGGYLNGEDGDTTDTFDNYWSGGGGGMTAVTTPSGEGILAAGGGGGGNAYRVNVSGYARHSGSDGGGPGGSGAPSSSSAYNGAHGDGSVYKSGVVSDAVVTNGGGGAGATSTGAADAGYAYFEYEAGYRGIDVPAGTVENITTHNGDVQRVYVNNNDGNGEQLVWER